MILVPETAPEPVLRAALAALVEHSQTGLCRQEATATRIKIRAVELALERLED